MGSGCCPPVKHKSFVMPAFAGMYYKPTGFLGGLFPTPLYHPALAGTPPEEGNWNYLGGSFQTPLYHLHSCRRASMQAGLRRNDNEDVIIGIQ